MSDGNGRSFLGRPGDLRGGSWNNNHDNVRAAYRNNNNPHNRNNNNGFRLVRRLTSPVYPCARATDAAPQPGGYSTINSRFQFMSTDYGLWNAASAGEKMAQVRPVCAQHRLYAM